MASESLSDKGDFRMKNTPKQKPIHEVRLGHIKAAVWRNETEAGVRYNVTFSRIYKDGDTWNSTDSFGRDDLLLLSKVADQAHSWIFAQSQESESATKSASKENDDR
jgi:hypothetical protein